MVERHFDPHRVKAGNRRLLATALILAAITLIGLALKRPHGRDDFGSVLYIVGLSGLVGFSTNWLAIKMLFRPRKPIFGLQGVIPRQRVNIAGRVSRLMEERLISGHRLHAWMEETGAIKSAAKALSDNLPELLTRKRLHEIVSGAASSLIDAALPDLSTRLREMVITTVKEKAGPMAAMALPMVEPMLDELEGKLGAHLKSPEALDKLVDRALPTIEEALHKALKSERSAEVAEVMVGNGMESLLKNLRVADLLESEILKQDDAEIEQMIDDAAADQLVFLQVAGGVLGMLAGLAIIWPWLLIPYFAPLAIALIGAVIRMSGKTQDVAPSTSSND